MRGGMKERRYTVVENTPGYLPEDDDPFVGDLAECNDVAKERVESLVDEGGYHVVAHDIGYWRLSNSDSIYDLGRVVEVIELEA